MTGFRALLTCLAVLSAAPAIAASSAWYQTEGGRVRLVVLPERADGSIPALLDIRLEPGWKTYWRDPGQSGIPPTISFTGASGLTLESIRFPVPKHFDDGFSRYTGYDRSVALPLMLKRNGAGSAATLVSASVFLGVCKDICIPVQADLSVDLQAGATAEANEAAELAAAEAALPEPPSADFMVTGAHWSDDGKSLHVTFTAPGAAPPQVFVSGPAGFQFGSGTTPARSGDAYRVEVPLLQKPKAASLSGAAILFTAESGGRAMETPLAID
ncbi:MAG TPA: protein-disulfide reductase DsbD domain-containing protein [Mycoplana sp.]|nr:protein-disulfide reductase DsbD domain-containing protein [Mycoplana sp.]